MMTNSYTSSNDSTLPSNLSVTNTELPFTICFILRPSSFVYFANFFLRILLLLPLCTLILYLCVKQRKQQHSNSMAAKMSHSDYFTYHLVVMELVGLSGLIICCCAVFTLHVKTFSVGLCIYSVVWYGELCFHTLTCVERFLAVVHPIAYVSLRSERGVKIRNICTGCSWLLSVGVAGLQILHNFSAEADFFLLTFSLVVISLCSVSVLCVLIRPRPGEQGGDAERVDQSKKRAFFTIVVILGVLLIRCVWNLTWTSLLVVSPNQCMIMSFGVWLNIPSVLVLPLLFLQKAGLLARCTNVKQN